MLGNAYLWIGFLILSLFLVSFIPDSYAITKTWIGVDDVWNDALNWSPTGVPGFNDEVLIDGGNPGNSVVHIDSNLVHGGFITISSGDTLTIDNGVTFNPDASVTVEVGGEIINSGTTFHTSQLNNSGLISNFNSYDIGTAINSGSIVNQAGTLQFTSASSRSSGTITNAATLNILSSILENTGTLDNQGTLVNSGEINNYGQFTNSGTVTQPAGSTNNRCSGIVTNTGSFSGVIDESSGIPPISGDWIIIHNCTLVSSPPFHAAPANVRVRDEAVFTVPSGTSIKIDFINFNLTVELASGVLIQAGGKIESGC